MLRVEWRPGYWTQRTVAKALVEDYGGLVAHVEELKRVAQADNPHLSWLDVVRDPVRHERRHHADFAFKELREYFEAQRRLMKTLRVRNFAGVLA